MKKMKLFLTTFISCIILIGTANANVLYNDNISSSFTKKEDTTGLAYSVNEFVCYSCGLDYDEDNDEITGTIADGIGVYFYNKDKWETGSAMVSSENSDYGENALTAFFVAASLDGKTPSKIASDFDRESLLNNNANGALYKELNSNITITVTPELLPNKRYIKLNYLIKNSSSSNQEVYISTFNDIYIGGIPEDVCNDTAKYESNTNITPIKNGFNAFTGGNKYMTVVLQENNNLLGGLINDGGGTFKHYFGEAIEQHGTAPNIIDSSAKQNMYSNTDLPFTSKSGDSEFNYSWSKTVAPGTTEFSTLIGLGNSGKVGVTIDKITPNYNKDNNQITLTTDDKNINIEGTINDNCSMGTYSYKINGVCVDDPKKTDGCKEYTYYTDNSFTTSYNAEIPTELLTDSENGNTFTVTANSVACGTDTEEAKFTLYKDRKPVGKLGINSNYIVLGIILIGGIGLFIYSRKQNKFPQV